MVATVIFSSCLEKQSMDAGSVYGNRYTLSYTHDVDGREGRETLLSLPQWFLPY